MKQRVHAIMLFVVAAVITLFVSSPQAQEQKGPQIHIKETTYDFGKIVEGAQVRHVFEVANTGDAALDIQRIQPT